MFDVISDGLGDRRGSRGSRLERVSVGDGVLMDVEQAKLYLKVDHDDEDDLIKDLIASAQSYMEDFTNTSLALQEWSFTVSNESGYVVLPLELPRPPFRELLGVVAIDALNFDTNLDLETLVVRGSNPAQLVTRGSRWLTAVELTVNYRTGYTDMSQVPHVFRQAMRLLIGHWYENREASTPANRDLRTPVFSVNELLQTQRIMHL